MRSLLSVLILYIPLAAIADFMSAEMQSGATPHVHGLSALTIAMQGRNLEMQLTSPAMDLVGFEHQASTATEIKQVENVASILGMDETLFLLSAGECHHIQTRVDTTHIMKAGHEGHTHDAAHGHHREIIANYKYHCEDLNELSSISVFFFKAFPQIEKIKVMWIQPSNQGAATLTKNNNIVEFN